MPLDYKNEYLRYKQHYLKKAQTLYQQPITKASISLVLSLLTISFFGFFAIKPTLTTIARLIKEVKEQKVVDQSLQRKINDLTKAQTTYQAVEPNIYLVERALPKDSQIIRFTQELNFLAFKHTLLITAFNFNEFNLFGGEAIEKTEPIAIEFNITLAGQYPNLRDFLADFDNLDRLIKIDSVSFTTESDIQGALESEISGKVFHFP